MIATFKQAQAFASIRQKIHTLPIPAYLEKELQKVDWKSISCGMEHARDILPLAINGMLADEEDIAEHCSSHIWWQIYSQGHIFIATYEVAVIFSRMLRHYTGNQAIQWRLVQFFSKVLGILTGYSYNKIYYRKIITAFRTSAQIIPQWVNAADDHTARIAQYLLVHVGQYIPGTEDMLKKEWNHPVHSLSRRSYAALSLAAFYTGRKQRENLIAVFSAAFSREEDRFLQMVIALQLVTTSKKKAQAPWISALITAFIELDHATEQFLYRLRPFADNYHLPDYILQVLGYANPEVLQACMEPVIALLPDADKLKQANALEVIFALLFTNKSALKRRTSLQKRALLAAATVIDQHSYVIRHNEVFGKYQLPYDASQLRALVGT
jgi:hypothetical protein